MLYIELHYVKGGVIFIDFIFPNYSVFETGNKQTNSATIIKSLKDTDIWYFGMYVQAATY